MLYAYGATVIEIVRRREFCEYNVFMRRVSLLTETFGVAEFFFHRAQSILDVMAKFSYVHQLPF